MDKICTGHFDTIKKGFYQKEVLQTIFSQVSYRNGFFMSCPTLLCVYYGSRANFCRLFTQAFPGRVKIPLTFVKNFVEKLFSSFFRLYCYCNNKKGPFLYI